MENKHTNKILDHEKKCYYPGSCPWTFPHVNLPQTAGTEKNISLNTVIQKKNQPKIFQMKKSRKKKWGNEEKNHKLGKEDYEKKNIYIYGHERDRNDYWRLWHKFQKKAKQNLK